MFAPSTTEGTPVSGAPRRALTLAADWSHLLAEACAGRGLRAVYQPLVDLRNGKVAGYEGLTRFTSIEGIGPERWFAAARAQGCEAELEAATLANVMAARGRLPPGMFLSVNVSPAALTSSPVTRVLGCHEDLRGIVIELTEQTRVDSYRELTRHLDVYRSRGALLAIDDAGSGYSSLAHILELRPSILKLDRPLISGVDRDEAKRVLVEMLGLYSGHLDAWILAEGVETLGELDTLRRLGVRLAQGWALGRPAEPWADADHDAVTAMLRPPVDLDEAGCTVKLLVQPACAVPSSEWRMDGGDDVIAVDDAGAPAEARIAGSGCEPRSPVLCVPLTASVSDVAGRALARTAERRFEPVVCIDADGRVAGIVRIERILELLARLVASGDYDDALPAPDG